MYKFKRHIAVMLSFVMVFSMLAINVGAVDYVGDNGYEYENTYLDPDLDLPATAVTTPAALAIQPLSGTVRYASNTGSGNADGTTPANSMAFLDAYAASQDGDTISLITQVFLAGNHNFSTPISIVRTPHTGGFGGNVITEIMFVIGNSTGDISQSSDTVSFQNITIDASLPDNAWSGCVFIIGGGRTLTLGANTVVRGGSTTAFGGAIMTVPYSTNHTLNIEGAYIIGNRSGRAGAISFSNVGTGGTSTINMRSGRIANNWSFGRSGAIEINDNVILNLYGGQIVDNFSSLGGYGSIHATGTVNIRNGNVPLIIRGNRTQTGLSQSDIQNMANLTQPPSTGRYDNLRIFGDTGQGFNPTANLIGIPHAGSEIYVSRTTTGVSADISAIGNIFNIDSSLQPLGSSALSMFRSDYGHVVIFSDSDNHIRLDTLTNQPQNLQATAVDATTAELTWNTVTDAVEYEVVWRVAGTTAWSAPQTAAQSTTPVTHNVSGLPAGDIEFRVRALMTAPDTFGTPAFASVRMPTPHPTPTSTIDFTNERLTGLVPNAEYTINGTTFTADATGNIPIDPTWMGTDLAIIRTASGGYLASTAQTLPIPTRPAAPNASATHETAANANDGTITDATTDMEFRLLPSGTWTDVTATPVTDLAPGTYEVRLRATTTAFASAPATVTVNPFTAGVPAAPTGLTATPSIEAVTLNWTAAAGATGHQVRYRTAPSGEWSAWINVPTGTTHTISPLTGGQLYDFEVRGVNAQGEGTAATTQSTPQIRYRNPAATPTFTATSTFATTNPAPNQATITVPNSNPNYIYAVVNADTGAIVAPQGNWQQGNGNDITFRYFTTGTIYKVVAILANTPTAARPATVPTDAPGVYLITPPQPIAMPPITREDDNNNAGRDIITHPTTTGYQYVLLPLSTSPQESDWQNGDGAIWEYPDLDPAQTFVLHRRVMPTVGATAFPSATPIPGTATVSVTGITVSPTTANLVVGDTETITHTIAPLGATNQTVTWTTNNPAIATVDADGVITAVAPGTATITVTTADGNHTATVVVTVTAAATVPAAPTGLTATAGVEQVALSWTAAVGATSHQVRYRTAPTGAWSAWINVPIGTTHTVSPLTGGQLYDFEVRGVNTTGTGPAATANATPFAPSVGGGGHGGGDSSDSSGGGTTIPPSAPRPTTQPPATPTTDPAPQPLTIPGNYGEVGVTAAITNNQVALTFTEATITNLIDTAEDSTVVFNLDGIGNVAETTLPADVLAYFIEAELAVAFNLPQATITFDVDALSDLLERAEGLDLRLVVEPEEESTLAQTPPQAAPNWQINVYSVVMMYGNTIVTNLDGTISVKVDAEERMLPSVWAYDAHGNLVRIPSTFDEYAGTVTIATDAFPFYIVHEPPFMHFIINQYAYGLFGNPTGNDVTPFIDPAHNRTMIPLRVIAEGLGANVNWEDQTRTVTVFANGRVLQLTIDVPLPGGMGTPVITNNRTLVPARYVSEVLGATVAWDAETQGVYIWR